MDWVAILSKYFLPYVYIESSIKIYFHHLGPSVWAKMVFKSPLGGGKEPIIRTRQESWCLPYAGLKKIYFNTKDIDMALEADNTPGVIT